VRRVSNSYGPPHLRYLHHGITTDANPENSAAPVVPHGLTHALGICSGFKSHAASPICSTYITVSRQTRAPRTASACYVMASPKPSACAADFRLPPALHICRTYIKVSHRCEFSTLGVSVIPQALTHALGPVGRVFNFTPPFTSAVCTPEITADVNLADSASARDTRHRHTCPESTHRAVHARPSESSQPPPPSRLQTGKVAAEIELPTSVAYAAECHGGCGTW
jgi:hypothetical protein